MDATETQLSIANQALTRIGAKILLANSYSGGLFTDGSPNAAIMNIIYNPSLQQLLEEHPWSFATNTITPTLITLLQPLVDFGDGVINPYTVPPDFLSLYLVNAWCTIRFEVLKSPFVASNTYAMISNNASLMMKYIFNQTDPTQYTAKFIDALVSKLAYNACFKISEAAQYKVELKAEYAENLMSAQAADSKNSSPDEPYQDQWMIARLVGSAVNAPGIGQGLNIGF